MKEQISFRLPRSVHADEIACRVDAAVKALSRARAIFAAASATAAAAAMVVAEDCIDEAERDLGVVQALVRREVE